MDNKESHFELADFIQSMIDDFITDYHEVYLVPNKDEWKESDGRHIRAPMNKNPLWYRKICEAFPKRKQPERKKKQTSVKKEDVIKVMNTLIKRGWSDSKYDPFIIEEARNRYEREVVPFKDQF